MSEKNKSKSNVSKVIAIFKKPGQPDRVEVKGGKAGAQPPQPEPQPQPKADFKPRSQFVRITPRMPKLR